MSLLLRLLALPILAAVLVVVCLSIQLTASSLHIPLDLRAEKGFGQVLLYLLLLACILLFVWITGTLRNLAALGRSYLSRANRLRLLVSFYLGAGIALAASALAFGAASYWGGVVIDTGALVRINLAKLQYALIAAITVPVLVATEEIAFRAFVYGFIRGYARTSDGRFSITIATLVSAFIFAFAHGFRDPAGWLAPNNQKLFIGLFLLGVLLALAYETSGSLVVSMGIHAGFVWTKIPERWGLILFDQKDYWWAGVNGDSRTAPIVWLLFSALAVVTIIWRRRLFAVAAVERARAALPGMPSQATISMQSGPSKRALFAARLTE